MKIQKEKQVKIYLCDIYVEDKNLYLEIFGKFHFINENSNEYTWMTKSRLKVFEKLNLNLKILSS
jgi:hypothetical protein